MIRIVSAAALATVVLTDAVTTPPPMGAGAEPPNVQIGTPMAVNTTNAGCAGSAWPYYPAACIGGRGAVRIIDGSRTISPPIAEKKT